MKEQRLLFVARAKDRNQTLQAHFLVVGATAEFLLSSLLLSSVHKI
jgi:hypothetical protein